MSQSTGFQQLSTIGSDYNSQAFIVQSIMSRMRTSMLCSVLKVTNNGGVSPVGTVDIQPLVNQITGAGIGQADGIVHGVPYFRLQGGSNAIIIDPQVGDVGLAIFADRDISNVVENKAQANPGSGRRYHISDALYIGGFLSAAPTQYIQFNSSGITIFSPSKITVQATGDISVIAGGSASVEAGTTASITATESISLSAPEVTISGVIALVGNTSVTGTMMNNGANIGSTHAHPVTGVQTGTSTIETGSPNE